MLVSEIITVFLRMLSATTRLASQEKSPNILLSLPREIVKDMTPNNFLKELEMRNITTSVSDHHVGRTSTTSLKAWSNIKKNILKDKETVNNFYIGFSLWMTNNVQQHETLLRDLRAREYDIIAAYDEELSKHNVITYPFDDTDYHNLKNVANIEKQIAWCHQITMYMNDKH